MEPMMDADHCQPDRDERSGFEIARAALDRIAQQTGTELIRVGAAEAIIVTTTTGSGMSFR